MKIVEKTNEVKVPIFYKPVLTIAGNSAELKFCSNFNHKQIIKKINKNEYMYLEDSKSHFKGEICEFQNHAKSRKENYKNILRSVKKCRDLINSNFFAEKNELFITLTYAENMKDVKKLYNDLKNFIRNFKDKIKNQKLLYILVIEPQARGAWHAHILFKNLSWTDKKIQWFVSKKEIEKMWNFKGFVKVEKVDNIDDLGSYLSSYLTNLENGKKYSRLHLYPKGINIFRYSRNCKKPKIIKDKKFLVALKFLRKYWNLEFLPKPTFSSSVILKTDNDFEINISKINFHKKRNINEKLKINDFIDNSRYLVSKFLYICECNLKI